MNARQGKRVLNRLAKRHGLTDAAWADDQLNVDARFIDVSFGLEGFVNGPDRIAISGLELRQFSPRDIADLAARRFHQQREG
jgi:hypothetical protein